MKLSYFVFWFMLFATAFGTIFFEEKFEDDLWSHRWIASEHKGIKFGKFSTTRGKFYADPKNKGLKTMNDTHLYGLSTKFPAFSNENKTLVLQYSVKYEQNIGETGCAGGYMKIFNCSFQPKDLHGATPHLLSFGPDICGNDTKRIQMSINYMNTQHSFKKRIVWNNNDIYTHVYTFILKPDQSYQVLIDSDMVHRGNLLDTDWSIIPRKIKDPNATKPSTWDDRPTIPDPNATKPVDWDQRKYTPNPNVTKPIDWDDNDLEWTPGFIENPNYKGDWKPGQIANPTYMGPWEHPVIDNPDFQDSKIYSFPHICGIGFEIWQQESGTIFDNVLLTDSVEVAAAKRRNIKSVLQAEKNMKKLNDKMKAQKKKLETEQGDRERESKEEEFQRKLMTTICVAVSFSVLAIIIVILSAFFVFRYRTKYLLSRKEMNDFLRGNDMPLNNQGDGNNGVNVEGSNHAEKQPYDKCKYEVSHSSFHIDLSRYLGSGEFGIVCHGSIKRGDKEVEVAVKTLNIRGSTSGQNQGTYLALKGLISEIKVLSYIGEHENILKLEGAYTAKLRLGKVCLFLELCELGSLEKYLRSYKPAHEGLNLLKNTTEQDSMEMETRKRKLPRELLQDFGRWAVQIASAMEYLASKKVIHADLATRNVLLNSQKIAKIADFGLSRRLYNYCEYTKSESEPLPWRWMPPESLRKMIFNEKTDVWSFGVTLWEIFTLADQPYPGLSWDMDFPAFLERGLRLTEPKLNQNDYYSVMMKCWDTDPDRRPTFSALKSTLSAKLTTSF